MWGTNRAKMLCPFCVLKGKIMPLVSLLCLSCVLQGKIASFLCPSMPWAKPVTLNFFCTQKQLRTKQEIFIHNQSATFTKHREQKGMNVFCVLLFPSWEITSFLSPFESFRRKEIFLNSHKQQSKERKCCRTFMPGLKNITKMLSESYAIFINLCPFCVPEVCSANREWNGLKQNKWQ